jgi:tetratricopeptide (TPR) repeat protein
MDRAYALYYDSKLDAALPDLDHVLSLNPKHSEALYLRAQVYEGLNRAADARRDFDAAAAVAPDDKDIFGERALFFVRQGDYVAALADADRLVARVSYVAGDYQAPETFVRLRQALGAAQRPVVYLAIPPSLFGTVREHKMLLARTPRIA